MKGVSMPTKTQLTVCFATREDVPFILELIRELAAYEHSLESVRATPENLEYWIFDEPVAECLIGSIDGVPRGIALFFKNFSTWEAAPG
jgi:hypothetical protein